jgi:ABC-type lipoprotein export system ATPase subunit
VLTLLREVSAETGNILVIVTHDKETRERFDDVVDMAELGA